MFTDLKFVIVIFAVLISCTKQDYKPKLVEYLKAEKELRKRVSEEQGLNDSLTILQQKYDINLEKEISKFTDNPETWLKLLKELKIEK